MSKTLYNNSSANKLISESQNSQSIISRNKMQYIYNSSENKITSNQMFQS